MADYGQQAFPTEGGDMSGVHPNPGMSMREFYAGLAMAGMLANFNFVGPESDLSIVADRAFEAADYMIARQEYEGS